MFSCISLSGHSNSRRTATLCSMGLHVAAVGALWMAGQAITAPPISHHEPREAVMIVTPPPRLFRPRTQPKGAVERFEVERAVPTRAPEVMRAETPAPEVEARKEPARSLLAKPEIAVRPLVPKPASFPEVAPVAAPKRELQTQANAFGAALSRAEARGVALSGNTTSFGAVGPAKTQSPVAAARGTEFGRVEIGHAARPSETVGEAGFGAAERQATAAATIGPAAQPSRNQPVKIVWKPVPKYSEEGIRHRIEGDVVLRVRFLAKGTVEALEVVSGLGYGLDEYAVQAAESIRFEPAMRGDQAIDYTAQVRIRFELAY